MGTLSNLIIGLKLLYEKLFIRRRNRNWYFSDASQVVRTGDGGALPAAAATTAVVTVRRTYTTTCTLNNNKHNASHYKILTCLFVGDFIFCFIDAIVFIKDVDSSSSLACQIQGVGAMSFACFSVVLLCLLAYDRYCTIVLQEKITSTRVLILLSIAFIYSLLLGFSLLIPPLRISRTSSRIFCTTEWYNRKVPEILIHTCIALFTLISTMGLTTFFYFRIYRAVRTSSIAAPSGLSSSAGATRQKQNIDIAKKMSLLVFFFLLGWGTYLSLIITSLYYGEPVAPWYDVVATILAFTNSASNPIVYNRMNNTSNKSRNQVAPISPTSVGTRARPTGVMERKLPSLEATIIIA